MDKGDLRGEIVSATGLKLLPKMRLYALQQNMLTVNLVVLCEGCECPSRMVYRLQERENWFFLRSPSSSVAGPGTAQKSPGSGDIALCWS